MNGPATDEIILCVLTMDVVRVLYYLGGISALSPHEICRCAVVKGNTLTSYFKNI